MLFILLVYFIWELVFLCDNKGDEYVVGDLNVWIGVYERDVEGAGDRYDYNGDG